MKSYIYLICAAVLLIKTAMQSEAALTTVNFDSGGFTITDNNGITLLTGGNPAINGDGAVLQLGYFTSGTSATPFLGTWVALTGEGGANAPFSTGTGKTSIGDDFNLGGGTGTFALSLDFNTSVANTTNSLPAAGTPLGIRIYNKITISGSTFYETISSTLSTWRWVTPADAPNNPVVNISLDDSLSSLRRENGTGAGAAATTTFNTNLPVTAPEPSSMVLLVAGFFGLFSLRRSRLAR